MRSTAACPKIIYEYIVHVRIMYYVKIRSEKNRRRLDDNFDLSLLYRSIRTFV
jgi:hypothetical protein